MIAALFVDPHGIYAGLPGVELWDEKRDARNYSGPWPVVAHPPCSRWCRLAGLVEACWGHKRGEDGGCFAAAIAAVRRWGGVLEHPAYSDAWITFDLPEPPRGGGWLRTFCGGAVCYVEQGKYGHIARKPTWLYASGVELTRLRWGKAEQRLHPTALAKHGYAKACRIGMLAMIGGKDKTRIRGATPPEFRDALLAIAATASPSRSAPRSAATT